MPRHAKSKSERASWGGKREGAGRPKSSALVAHAPRPRIERRRCPVKITLKVRSNLPSLREEFLFEVFEKATLRARRFGLRIIEYSLLDSEIHMICEFKKKEELEKAFKSLNTSLALALKKIVKERTGLPHKGPVFLGRYHMKLLGHPDEMKLALREVLLLPYERDPIEGQKLKKDLYSSGLLFQKWAALLGKELSHYPALSYESHENESNIAKERAKRITATPQFWLSQAGWLKSRIQD